MARINLLPWRKELRDRKNKEFNTLIAATVGVTALLVGIGYTLLKNDLDNQLAANAKIEEANAQLDIALKSIEDLEAQREQMLSQMKVIQDLQGRRSIPVRVWDDMARAIPQAMYINNIKREQDLITIEGKAENANVVAALVRNLNASEWLDGSAVVTIKSKIEAYQEISSVKTNEQGETIVSFPEDSYVDFVVTTQVYTPKPEEENAQTAEGVDGQATEATVITADTPIDESLTAPVGVEAVGTPAEPAPAPQEVTPAPADQTNTGSANAPAGGQ